MSRADHWLNARGQCRRCGLSRAHAPHCPPGYWMTKHEAKTWDELPSHERGPYEKWCLYSGPARKGA